MNAIVTGATKGIGLSVVKHLAANNYNLALCARNKTDLQNLVQELSHQYPQLKIFYFEADFSNGEQVKLFAEFVSNHFAFTDVLINNAGLFISSTLFDEAEEDLKNQMQLNLYAPHYLSKHFGRQMKVSRKGHIINICSVASTQLVAAAASYSISKTALLGLTRLLREELMPHSVKVSAILPGSTLTASWEGSQIPADRFIDPDDIARAVISCLNMSPGTNVDEIVIRPLRGNV